MIRRSLCSALLLLMPVVAQSQRIPDLNAPKRAAINAANAENARLSEQTGQAVVQQRMTTIAGKPMPGAPAQQAPRSGPGSNGAAGAQSPVGAAGAAPALPAGIQPVTREIFTYEADGRRDPFFSLILTEDLRPLLTDLKLVGIVYDATGRKSVAIMRDILTNAQYRVNVGMTLGRMRVAQIKPRAVIFTVEEFGLSRQDSLFMADTSSTRIR